MRPFATIRKKFDRFSLTPETLALSKDDIAREKAKCDADTLAALGVAHARIVAFHERQKPDDLSFTDDAGLSLGYRWSAVGAAGLYVPGGTAAYPSSVLMNAVPAKVAGVKAFGHGGADA